MSDIFGYNGQSLYGNYRTRTFSDIFGSYEIFKTEYDENPIITALSNNKINSELLYYMLYSRYANSNVASSDENRFKYQLFSLIFQYGPTWARELEIQSEVRGMTIDELREGSRSIYNKAQNPSSEPSTQDTEELTYVNDQTVAKSRRSKADAYAILLSLLKRDVTEDFLSKFKRLFLAVVQPELPLWYETQGD